MAERKCLMKLLHTADLHLDSPFAGKHPSEAQEKRELQRRVFKRIFSLAKETECDMILIAGDLFDGKYVTPETESLCLRLFREAECPVVLAPGNHDPFVAGSFYRREDMPENVYVFSSTQLQCFEFEELGVKLFGYAFTSSVLPESPLAGAELPEEDESLRILCAHGDLGMAISRYAPVIPSDAVRLRLDYCALGHIHRAGDVVEQDGTVLCYSGIPQGRSYDETGEGSVRIVTLSPYGMPKVELVTVSEEMYLWEELDISDCEDTAAAMKRIGEFVQQSIKKGCTHLRLTLTGHALPETVAELSERGIPISEELAELVLQDRTVPYADGAYLERDVGIKGAFYRSLYPKLIHEDPSIRREALLALQIGLAAIENRRIPGEESGE